MKGILTSRVSSLITSMPMFLVSSLQECPTPRKKNRGYNSMNTSVTPEKIEGEVKKVSTENEAGSIFNE